MRGLVITFTYCWVLERCSFGCFLHTHTLTIEVRGVAVSWAGVSQCSEVRHHVTSSSAVNSWTWREQDDEVEQLEDIWSRLMDRQQDQAVSSGQAGQCDHQIVGCEAVQTRRGLIQNQNTWNVKKKTSSITYKETWLSACLNFPFLSYFWSSSSG